MKSEDYSKYYINGSDHYLIPKDVFVELFDELENLRKDTKKLGINKKHQEINGKLREEIEIIDVLNEHEKKMNRICKKNEK